MTTIYGAPRDDVGCACMGFCRNTGICPLHGGLMERNTTRVQQEIVEFFKPRVQGPERSMLRFTEAELADLLERVQSGVDDLYKTIDELTRRDEYGS